VSKKLDLSGKGKASDAEIEAAANDIFNIMRIMNSPKDAAATLALAHFKLITASFNPEFRSDAIADINNHTKILIELVNGGWQ
jgi:Holliday junction resolvasome RuvABC endonuclease subunit